LAETACPRRRKKRQHSQEWLCSRAGALRRAYCLSPPVS
jgi:hypothetical protein